MALMAVIVAFLAFQASRGGPDTIEWHVHKQPCPVLGAAAAASLSNLQPKTIKSLCSGPSSAIGPPTFHYIFFHP